ncbi:serine/threonine protein kinase [Streptomyces sp. NBC_01186]|uniref:serine/threonine-protein kinase n=1 Tax=Streptomyces sp. NBC_01186 TaxID=2903765 RepID=UPI002E0DC0B9|nr:serine/threonine protein kinase [Streptomyces sp. NBC_01186]
MAKFRKTEKIRAGGQATVWKAIHLEADKEVAIKFPLESTELTLGPENRARFEREVRCQSALKHPGIMPVIGMNLNADNPFYVMPVADFSLLDQINLKRLSIDDISGVMLPILDALHHAHSEGVIHRDLKPENILRLGDRWVVSDFGLCRDINSNSLTITRGAEVFGSLAYMAPEQYDDAHAVDQTADIYAIGQILYHCLVGEIPYPRVKPAKIPSKFRYLITRCVAEDSSERFQSVSDLRRSFEAATTPEDELYTPTERAQLLLESASDGDDASLAELVRFLVEQSDDELLYKEFLPSLSLRVLRDISMEHSSPFSHIVRVFDGYADGGHPFSYTDGLADFFRNAARSTLDSSLHRVCLNRVFRLGVDHNRFYIGNVFAAMVNGLRKSEEVQYVADLLADDPRGSDFMTPYLKEYSLPPVIRKQFSR